MEKNAARLYNIITICTGFPYRKSVNIKAGSESYN